MYKHMYNVCSRESDMGSRPCNKPRDQMHTQSIQHTKTHTQPIIQRTHTNTRVCVCVRVCI